VAKATVTLGGKSVEEKQLVVLEEIRDRVGGVGDRVARIKPGVVP